MAENFVRVPWSIEESELDPYQFRLWVHIARVGVCWQTVRTLADACKMSIGQTWKTQAWLLEHGYLEHAVDAQTGKAGVRACSPHEQTQQNRAENRSPDEQTQQLERSPHEQCSPHEQDVHYMNKNGPICSPHERHLKKNTIEEEHREEKEREEGAREKPNGFWAIPDNLNSTAFVQAWARWLDYVEERGLEFTETQAALTLQELSEAGETVATASVITSIRRGWRNIYLSDPEPAQPRASPNGHHKQTAEPKGFAAIREFLEESE